MSDIFLSYSSKDRDRVAPIRESLTALGYDVFWDQQVPAGIDWDTWIRGELSKSRCALVVWSEASVASPNVRHEATVAEASRKLIPALIDPLTASQFPMGLYSVQAANLVGWSGHDDNAEWRKLLREVELRIKPYAPLWLQTTINALEANLMAEKARVQAAENRARTLEAKIGSDANMSLDAERERDRVLEQIKAISAQLDTERQSNSALIEQGRDLEARLVNADQHRMQLADRLGLGTSNKTASRGHVWILDVILFAAAAAGLLLTDTLNMSNTEIRTIYIGGGLAAGLWATVTLLRLITRRKIEPIKLVVGTQPASMPPPAKPQPTTSAATPAPKISATSREDGPKKSLAFQAGQFLASFAAPGPKAAAATAPAPEDKPIDTGRG